MVLYRNIDALLTLQGAEKKQARRIQEADLSIIEKASMLVDKGRIIWVGPHRKFPKSLYKKSIHEVDLKNATVLPGFVECHTHLVFAGNRAAEFEMRNQGVTYQEIAARGGGILSTMKHTRESSKKKLIELSQSRIQKFVKQGVTTVEIKSGYALNLSDEIKCLEVMKELKGPRVVPTFLGAHAIPPEFNKDAELYLNFLIDKVLPIIKKKSLACRVDIFVEKGFFDRHLAKKFLQKCKSLGFEICLHADQLSLSGGGELGVELSALSADHLIQIEDSQIRTIAGSDMTSVLLPAADLYMKCKYPPARKLIDLGGRVALATDFNPGSSPTQDLSLVGLLARLEMKMTLPEVIVAYSLGAAYALGLQNDIGSLAPGKSADFVCISDSWRELFYSVGGLNASKVYAKGRSLKLT